MRFFALLFLGYTNLSLALGFGDVTLKSHLGEPLAVSIAVTDVEKSPDTSCFTIKDNNDVPAFKKVSSSFKQTNSGYRLNIVTYEPIHEPIVNLYVTFNCEPNLNREYVLLLDPIGIHNSTDTSDTPFTSDIISIPNTASGTNVKDSETTVSISNPASQASAKKQKPKRKKITATSEIDRKLMEAYTGKSQSQHLGSNQNNSSERSRLSDSSANATQSHAAGGSSKPHLVISGGSTSPDTLPKLALRLDTQIDFARAETETQLNTDTLDEVTVMANRLAHLEKQITSLQNKNVQLQNEALKAKQEAKNISLLSEQLLTWSKYLLIVIGLIALMISGEWIRRRVVRDRLDREEAIWFDESHHSASHNDTSIFPLKELNKADESLLDDQSFGDTLNNQFNGSNSDALTLTENTNDENILENADVFIEHGRPMLAIQLLQNHLSDFPSESPKIWLKLLSLIAKDGTEAEYEQTVAECKQFFNIKMPSYAEANTNDNSSIEDYPHILARLEGMWGSQYAVGFLNDLIYNQQSQPREGFSRGTFDELFFLKQVAEILNANAAKEQTSLYKPTTVKPKLENIAFNEEAFSHSEADSIVNTTEVDTASQPKSGEEMNEHDLPANLFSTSLESSAFQQVPSYEVDLLAELDNSLDIKDNTTDQGLLNSELIPRSDTQEKPVAPEITHTLQAEEIQFPAQDSSTAEIPAPELPAAQSSLPELPSFNDSEDIFNINEPDNSNLNADEDGSSKAAKKSNLIEWDLPKKD